MLLVLERYGSHLSAVIDEHSERQAINESEEQSTSPHRFDRLVIPSSLVDLLDLLFCQLEIARFEIAVQSVSSPRGSDNYGAFLPGPSKVDGARFDRVLFRDLRNGLIERSTGLVGDRNQGRVSFCDDAVFGVPVQQLGCFGVDSRAV
jgi:hypothetical protein